MNWDNIIKIINKHKKFTIVSHINLEGDALGSEIAFSGFLRNLGKDTVIINHDEAPESLAFLLNGDKILKADSSQSESEIRSSDAVFVLDVSNWSHLGNTAGLIKNSGKPVYCIDHHKCDNPIGDYSVINPQASSTGIMIYDLIKTYPKETIDLPIANSIYTSILTDTGNFRFSNTNSQAYITASELLGFGVDHSYICGKIYENNTWTRFGLLHDVLGTLTKEADGKIAYIIITDDMLKRNKGPHDDSEGFVDMLRSIKDVEVSILFREVEPQKTRATFRSKKAVDVQEIASVFGGGGHSRASGATLLCPLNEAVAKVIGEAKRLLRNGSFQNNKP